MRSKTLHRTDKFLITKRLRNGSRQSRKGSGRFYYELSCNMYYDSWNYNDFERVRDIIDPTRNRAGQFGKCWKYQNRQAAEQDLTLLLMML